MYYQSKQPNIPAELADNLINSLSGLTAIEGDELRRQVIMLLILIRIGLHGPRRRGTRGSAAVETRARSPQSGAGYQTGEDRYPRAPGYDLS
jgi:hypothetical protein